MPVQVTIDLLQTQPPIASIVQAMAQSARAKSPASAATTGYEAELWKMADTLRGSMDAAEYKHVVLGLIFLKYVSDAFEEMHATLEENEYAHPEDPDEYRAESIFWVPPEARWEHLRANAKQPDIGRLVDDSMDAVERANPRLKDVLPKDYARQSMDQTRLGRIIDMVSNIKVGDEAARSKDMLGRVYEYFLSRFADTEGKRGGEFYTPRCIVRLLVEMIEPFQGRVYDPCCGSSGMFVQSIEFIRAHQRRSGNADASDASNGPPSARPDISIYGQESNYTTWRLAKMNLAIRGIEGQIAQGDTFHNDRHPMLRGRLHPRQSALQRQRLGGRATEGRPALAVRRAAQGQRQLRLGPAHGAPPGAKGSGWLRAGQRLNEFSPEGRGGHPPKPSGRRTSGLYGRLARPALLLDADPRMPVAPIPQA